MPQAKSAGHTLLRRWRKRAYRTQAEMAAVLGVNQGYYSKLERGLMRPGARLGCVITRKTGIPLGVVLGL